MAPNGMEMHNGNQEAEDYNNNNDDIVVALKNNPQQSNSNKTSGYGPLRRLFICWNQFTALLRYIIQTIVVAMSMTAAKNPYCTIFGTVTIALALIMAGMATNMIINVDPNVLFTPANTIASQHFDWLVNFNPNEDFQQQQKNSRQQQRYLSVTNYDDDPSDFMMTGRNVMDNNMDDNEIIMYNNNKNNPFLTTNPMMMNQQQQQPLLQQQLVPSSHPQRRELLEGLTNVLNVVVHKHGQNVIEREGLANVFQVLSTLKKSVTRCNRNINRCTRNFPNVARFWDYNSTLFRQTVKTDDDVIDMLSRLAYPQDGIPVDIGSIAGKAKRNEDTGLVDYAESYIIFIVLPFPYNPDMLGRNFATYERPRDMKDGDPEQYLINELLELREELEERGDYTIEIFTRRSFEDELFRGIISDLPLVVFVIALMVVFTCVAFWKRDYVQSKCLLGLGGVLTIVLSILSGYGLMFIFAMPFTPMTTMLPFVVLGIGLDDTFIISLAFNRTDPTKDPIERMRETMNQVGLSISVTTITTTVAFILGLISSIPSIYWLCMYAWVTIVIDFVYQITFFVALVVLDARRIQAKRMDCCTCFYAGPPISCCNDHKRATIMSDDQDDGEEIKKDNKQQPQEIPNDVTLSMSYSNTPGGGMMSSRRERYPFDNDDDDEKDSGRVTHFADRLMGWYAKQLLRPKMKKAVLVVFSLYLILCIYSTTQMRQEFRISDMTPNDSYIRTFFRSMQDYTTRFASAIVYFRNVDQSNPAVRQHMMNYIDDLVAIPAFGEQPPFCWVKDYEEFKGHYYTNDELESMPFDDQMEEILDIPIMEETYGQTIRRDRNGTIKMSFCILWFSELDLYDVRDQLDTFHAQRNVSMTYAKLLEDQGYIDEEHQDEWPFFSWDLLYYLWEFYNIIIDELIWTTLSAVIAVTVVGLLVVPHWSGILYILPMVVILYIDLIGTLQFVGVRINAVSYVALVISIGIMVDFMLHVLIKYYESRKASREAKVRDALETMGASILLGGFSTFFATIPVLFASSKIFKDVFDSFFALVTLSICHGLILLPVVLSMIGPVGSGSGSDNEQCGHFVENDEDEEKNNNNDEQHGNVPLITTRTIEDGPMSTIYSCEIMENEDSESPDNIDTNMNDSNPTTNSKDVDDDDVNVDAVMAFLQKHGMESTVVELRQKLLEKQEEDPQEVRINGGLEEEAAAEDHDDEGDEDEKEGTMA